MSNSCQRFKAMVSDYIEGELDQQNQRLMENHLRDCLVCKSKISQLKQLIQSLRKLPRISVSPDFETVLRARVNRESRLARRQTKNWLPVGHFPLPAYVFVAAVLILALSAIFVLNKRLSVPIADRNDNWIQGSDQKVEPIINERHIYIIETQPVANIVFPANNEGYQSVDKNTLPDSSQAFIESKSWHESVQAVDSRVY